MRVWPKISFFLVSALIVHQQCWKHIKAYAPDWWKVSCRWTFFIAFSTERILFLGSCGRSWILWQNRSFRVWILYRSAQYTEIFVTCAQLLAPTAHTLTWSFWAHKSVMGNILQQAVTLCNVFKTLLSGEKIHWFKSSWISMGYQN
jgi:hypothetical protein